MRSYIYGSIRKSSIPAAARSRHGFRLWRARALSTTVGRYCAAAPYRSRRSSWPIRWACRRRCSPGNGAPRSTRRWTRSQSRTADTAPALLFRAEAARDRRGARPGQKAGGQPAVSRQKRRLRASVTGAEGRVICAHSARKTTVTFRAYLPKKPACRSEKRRVRRAAPFALAAAVLAALLTVTALAADLFSPLAGDDLALGAVYRGTASYRCMENRSDKELKFQKQLRLLRWDTSEEIAPAARPCAFANTAFAPHTEA